MPPKCCILSFLFAALQFAAAQNGFVTNIVDSRGDTGWYASLAIDANNNPVIAYNTKTGDYLKIATICGDKYKIEKVSDSNSRGHYCRIATNASGEIAIAHMSGGQVWFSIKSPWYGWQNANIQTATTPRPYLLYTVRTMDIKFDQRDIPHLAYISNSYGCQAVFDIQSACWVSSQIYSAKGDWTAIALNNDNCYLAFPGDSYLQINVFKNTSLGYNPLESVTASSMFDMDIDDSGEPVLAYRDINGNLWVAQHNMFGWTSQRITNSNETIYDSVSITCGSRGPAIAYRQTGTNNIILATCHAGWTKTIIDSNQDTRYLDIAFNDEGKPFISWYDSIGRCLKISGVGMTQTCPADYNNDGIVNNVDLAILVNDFGKDLPDGLTEMDGYAKIDQRDLRVFATYWLWQRSATD